MPRYHWKHQTPSLSIAVYGMQPRLQVLGRAAIAQAVNLGAQKDRVCRILPPSNQEGAGYQTLRLPTYDDFVEAEGVWLDEPASAAILQTADCPTIVLHNTATGRVVITHAGRPAMTPPSACGGCTANIATHAIRAVLQNGSAEHVFAWVLAGICGRCFVHDREGAERFIEPFDRFGSAIFVDRSHGALDLRRLIELQLAGYGIPKARIAHDDVCTFEHHGFASYRRKTPTDTRNTIMVIKH